MPRRFLCLICFALCVLASTRSAVAGAFLLLEGQGQFIAGVGYSEGSRRFDPSGQAVPAPAYRKAEASGYLEYGLTSWLSLVVAPTPAHESGAPATNSVTGSDSSAFGARLQLYGAPGRVIALQALVQPPIGAEGAATDIRLMLGQAFEIWRWAAFIDIEPGARLRGDPWPTEARLDLSAGVRPADRALLLLQDFNSLAPSGGPLIARQSYSKLQISIVYDLSRVWSVQLGAFRTIAGRNAIRETGPLAAVWYRF